MKQLPRLILVLAVCCACSCQDNAGSSWQERAEQSRAALGKQKTSTKDSLLLWTTERSIIALTAALEGKGNPPISAYTVICRQHKSPGWLLQVAWVDAEKPSATGIQLRLKTGGKVIRELYKDETAADYVGNIKDSERTVLFAFQVKLSVLEWSEFVGNDMTGSEIEAIVLSGSKPLVRGEAKVWDSGPEQPSLPPPSNPSP